MAAPSDPQQVIQTLAQVAAGGRATLDNLGLMGEAVQHHVAWLRRVNAALMALEDPDPALARPDAHEHCAFAGWLRDHAAVLAAAPEPAARRIHPLHHQVHETASRLFTARLAGTEASEQDYQTFIATVLAFNDVLHRVQAALWDQLVPRDPETGLKAETALEEQLRLRMAQATHRDHAYSLAVFQLDGLDALTATHGDAARAQALRFLAHHVHGLNPADDPLYRHGPDKVLLFLDGLPEAAARPLVDHMLTTLAEQEVVLETGAMIRLRAQAGVAGVPDPDHIAAALAQAQTNLRDTPLTGMGEGPA